MTLIFLLSLSYLSTTFLVYCHFCISYHSHITTVRGTKCLKLKVTQFIFLMVQISYHINIEDLLELCFEELNTIEHDDQIKLNLI